MDLKTLQTGGKAALARALAQVEAKPDAPETVQLLSDAYKAPRAHVVGITGPPGVGKSTLINALIAGWRAEGRTVGVIAVDPSSRKSKGPFWRPHAAPDGPRGHGRLRPFHGRP